MSDTDTDLKPCDLATLATFEFERVLMESGCCQVTLLTSTDAAGTTTGSVYLLGKLHGEQAIIHVQRTAIASSAAPELVKEGLENVNVFLENRPVRWLSQLFAPAS